MENVAIEVPQPQTELLPGMTEVRIPFPNPIQDRFKVYAGPEDPNAGNGRHHYMVLATTNDSQLQRLVGEIQFQHGALNEPGAEPNGILSACLLAILVDHFQSFQAGPFSSRETAIMITQLQEVQNWVARRQDDRANRGVQGKHEK